MDKKEMMPFIKTKDEDTANMLIAEGFQLVDKNGGFWTILNNKTVKFGATKIFYSNKLIF